MISLYMESKNKTNQPTAKLKLIDTENRLVIAGWQGEMHRTDLWLPTTSWGEEGLEVWD